MKPVGDENEPCEYKDLKDHAGEDDMASNLSHMAISRRLQSYTRDLKTKADDIVDDEDSRNSFRTQRGLVLSLKCADDAAEGEVQRHGDEHWCGDVEEIVEHECAEIVLVLRQPGTAVV